MVALTQDRNTPRRANEEFEHPVAASNKIYSGALVMRNATGFAKRATVATGEVCLGVAQELADNSAGVDGAINVKVRRGLHRFANDGTVARVDIGNAAWAVDDQTVADNNGTSTRSQVGIIRDVDSVGVWVEI